MSRPKPGLLLVPRQGGVAGKGNPVPRGDADLGVYGLAERGLRGDPAWLKLRVEEERGGGSGLTTRDETEDAVRGREEPAAPLARSTARCHVCTPPRAVWSQKGVRRAPDRLVRLAWFKAVTALRETFLYCDHGEPGRSRCGVFLALMKGELCVRTMAACR